MAKKKTDDIFYGFILNEGQEKLKEAIMSDDYNVVIADATAGSGKTLLAVACANMLFTYSPLSRKQAWATDREILKVKRATTSNPCTMPSLKSANYPIKQSVLIFPRRMAPHGSKLEVLHSCAVSISKTRSLSSTNVRI